MADDRGRSEQVYPCKTCGRKFVKESLVKHERVCSNSPIKKRKVFDSARQRAAGTDLTYRQIKMAQKKEVPPPKNNWRAKHTDFINTVRAARGVTKALAEGAPLPPPPPPSINPDYIQCPYCLRRFNQKAGERHINFCKEQSQRISNRPLPNAAAKAKHESRLQYQAPKPNRRTTPRGSTTSHSSGVSRGPFSTSQLPTNHTSRLSMGSLSSKGRSGSHQASNPMTMSAYEDMGVEVGTRAGKQTAKRKPPGQPASKTSPRRPTTTTNTTTTTTNTTSPCHSSSSSSTAISRTAGLLSRSGCNPSVIFRGPRITGCCLRGRSLWSRETGGAGGDNSKISLPALGDTAIKASPPVHSNVAVKPSLPYYADRDVKISLCDRFYSATERVSVFARMAIKPSAPYYVDEDIRTFLPSQFDTAAERASLPVFAKAGIKPFAPYYVGRDIKTSLLDQFDTAVDGAYLPVFGRAPIEPSPSYHVDKGATQCPPDQFDTAVGRSVPYVCTASRPSVPSQVDTTIKTSSPGQVGRTIKTSSPEQVEPVIQTSPGQSDTAIETSYPGEVYSSSVLSVPDEVGSATNTSLSSQDDTVTKTSAPGHVDSAMEASLPGHVDIATKTFLPGQDGRVTEIRLPDQVDTGHVDTVTKTQGDADTTTMTPLPACAKDTPGRTLGDEHSCHLVNTATERALPADVTATSVIPSPSYTGDDADTSLPPPARPCSPEINLFS